MAAAGGRVGHQTAVRTSERDDRFSRDLQELPKQGRADVQYLGSLWARELHDLAEDVGHAVRAIEALEHGDAAADLHLVNTSAESASRSPPSAFRAELF